MAAFIDDSTNLGRKILPADLTNPETIVGPVPSGQKWYVGFANFTLKTAGDVHIWRTSSGDAETPPPDVAYIMNGPSLDAGQTIACWRGMVLTAGQKLMGASTVTIVVVQIDGTKRTFNP